MEKVKVNKLVFEDLKQFIKFCRDKGWDDDTILHNHIFAIKNGCSSNMGINSLSGIELARILYYGYELEETPHEKLLREFKDYNEDVRFGIIRALDILGEKVEGITK